MACPLHPDAPTQIDVTIPPRFDPKVLDEDQVKQVRQEMIRFVDSLLVEGGGLRKIIDKHNKDARAHIARINADKT